MGKFETKGQIAGLFMTAAGVAVILIFFVNAEARKRGLLEENSRIENRIDSDKSNSEGALRRLSSFVRDLYDKSMAKIRRKRSLDSSYDQVELKDSLLDEALHDRKIRHIDEKVKYLGKENYLVQSILKIYGNLDVSEKEERNEHVENNDISNNKIEENPGDQIEHINSSPVDKPTGDDDSPADSDTLAVDESEAAETNSTVVHHNPLLEENVFQDVQGTKILSAGQDCTFHTLLIIVVTSLVNIIIFMLCAGSYKLHQLHKKLNRAQVQDKVWLCEDDDISKYYEDDIEPKLGPIVIS